MSRRGVVQNAPFVPCACRTSSSGRRAASKLILLICFITWQLLTCCISVMYWCLPFLWLSLWTAEMIFYDICPGYNAVKPAKPIFSFLTVYSCSHTSLDSEYWYNKLSAITKWWSTIIVIEIVLRICGYDESLESITKVLCQIHFVIMTSQCIDAYECCIVSLIR